jgi:hypothetical protein
MKNINIAPRTLVISGLIFALLLTTAATFAYQGNRGQGQGLGQAQAYSQQKMQHDASTVLVDLPVSELSETDRERLIYGQQEERLARDVYQALYDQYGVQTFANIARSENQHMEAIGSILDKYGIEQTQGYGDLQSTYDALIAQGSESLEQAIEVGIAIEILDIDDLDETLAETQNEDIKAVYANLRKGSVNHLNAFVRQLQQNGFETDADWEAYTSADQIDARGGQNRSGKSLQKGGRGNNQGQGRGQGQGGGGKNGQGRQW